MPTVTSLPPKLGEVRLAGSASGQALSTTETYINFFPNTSWVTLTPRNFSTAVVARWAFLPYLTVLKNQDALVTEPIHAGYLLQDADTTNKLILNSLDTLANGDALYIGSHQRFGGVFVDVTNTNSTVNTIAVKYATAPGVLGTLSVTDNTASGGASFAQDGTITWTPPTDWAAVSFNDAFGSNFGDWVGQTPIDPANLPSYTDPMFWVRFDWSAAFDSSVTVIRMFGLERNTAYDEMVPGQMHTQSVKWGFGGVSGIAALTDAGTANLLAQCGTYGHGKFRAPASVDVS